MAEKPAVLDAGRNAVFLPAETRTDLHIVDRLIRERCPSFVDHWTWPVTRPILYSLLGYRDARAMADQLQALSGTESFDVLARRLDFQLQVEAIERLPAEGRVIIAANHPTGLADGIAVWDVLKRVRSDIVFFANADAVRVNARFTDVIIPVEWLLEKRSPAKTRETLRQAGEAFAQEKCVVMFPSGKLAQLQDGALREREWFSTVVGLARKQKARIIPLNLQARNSQLYYFLSRVNGELRDITLFHELLNKRRSRFAMTFGTAIEPDDLQGPGAAVTAALQAYVAYALGDAPDLTFRAFRDAKGV
ncbi:MAG: 1-acyl-sn-glycerol-3-phosphate acyltransferase [Pseudomonadota bacterium]